MGVGMHEMQTSACITTKSVSVLTTLFARYARFTTRFKHIFNPPSGIKVHFVVGNHDVGYVGDNLIVS